MTRIALLVTALVAAVAGIVWAWSAHPDWVDPRAVLHPIQWARIQREAAGTGFPTTVDRAKARILLIERGTLPDDWRVKPHSGGRACWTLGGAVRQWQVCAARGRTQSIGLTWPNETAFPLERPAEAVQRQGIDLMLWVAAPDTTAADRAAFFRLSGQADLGPPAVRGSARIRGLYPGYGRLYLQAMPAALPQPEDWAYRPPPPPLYYVD